MYLPVDSYSPQEWLQPALSALTVSVQESDDLPLDVFGAQQSCTDQSWALLCTQDLYGHRQSGHIVLQLLAQVFCQQCY